MELPAWLTEDPEGILDEIVEARVLGGEDLDESSHATRTMVLDEARRAQEEIVHEIDRIGDGRIRIWRAVTLRCPPEEIGLGMLVGESWAFARSGAHAYDGMHNQRTYVVEGLVDPQDMIGAASLGFWSSGEGECRLRRQSDIEIVCVTTSANERTARHLWGRSTMEADDVRPIAGGYARSRP